VAERLDLEALFRLARPVDHVVISYTLSMVDDPAPAVEAAIRVLRPGGRLHLVDFGDGAGLPAWARHLLAAWLRRFGVRHRPEVEATLDRLATEGVGEYRCEDLAGRYAVLHRFTKATA